MIIPWDSEFRKDSSAMLNGGTGSSSRFVNILELNIVYQLQMYSKMPFIMYFSSEFAL